MKITKYIVCGLLGLLAGGACTTNFDEYNANPNQMDKGTIGPEGLLENLVFKGAECLLHRTWLLHGELVQYTVSTSSLNAYHRYIIPNGIPADHWATQFQWAATAQEMYELAVKREDPNCQAIALTMKALYLSNCTDGWGDIPFSEAFKGYEGVSKPKFDTQEEVYRGLYDLLEEANGLYDATRKLSTPAKDLLYNGDISKWRKFTNSLYLRLLMRCVNRDAELGVSEHIRRIAENPATYPVFASNADNATLFYTGEPPFRNYFGTMTDTNFTSTGRAAADNIIQMMARSGDPRLAIYFVRSGDSWEGLPSGEPVDETTNLSGVAKLNKPLLGDYSSPFSLMKYDEVLFILSEAAQRGIVAGGTTQAEAWYKAAVKASISYWSGIDPSGNVVGDDVVEAFLNGVAYDGTLARIIGQKYIALFWVGFEAWNDYRRTGFPQLAIGNATSNGHTLPTRFEYPVNTAKTNPERYAEAVARMVETYGGGDTMTTPVWWSKQASGK